jgi:hypothetical protein
MATAKLFNIADGTQQVFNADVPIKDIDYVAVYISENGISDYIRAEQSLYRVINDTVTFLEAPTGTFLRLVVSQNKSDLLNTPTMITTVGANMNSIKFIVDNFDLITDVATTVRTGFSANSEQVLTLGDVNNIQYFDLNMVEPPIGFYYDTVSKSMVNVSGRALKMQGLLGVQSIKTDSQNVSLIIFSETSSDGGATWKNNINSLRKWELHKDDVDFLTIPSITISDWLDGDRIRFGFYKIGTGGAQLTTPSETVNGEVVKGQSLLWYLFER